METKKMQFIRKNTPKKSTKVGHKKYTFLNKHLLKYDFH